jgi:hypothetical protein
MRPAKNRPTPRPRKVEAPRRSHAVVDIAKARRFWADAAEWCYLNAFLQRRRQVA